MYSQQHFRYTILFEPEQRHQVRQCLALYAAVRNYSRV